MSSNQAPKLEMNKHYFIEGPINSLKKEMIVKSVPAEGAYIPLYGITLKGEENSLPIYIKYSDDYKTYIVHESYNKLFPEKLAVDIEEKKHSRRDAVYDKLGIGGKRKRKRKRKSTKKKRRRKRKRTKKKRRKRRR